MKENIYNDDSLIVLVQHHELHHTELVEPMLRDIDAERIAVDGSLRCSKKVTIKDISISAASACKQQ
eukprot:8501330-Ditylum_brightwellii.AAC.1